MAFCHSDVPNNYADMKEWKKYSDPLLKRVILQFSIAILQHCQNHDGQFKKKKKYEKQCNNTRDNVFFIQYQNRNGT